MKYTRRVTHAGFTLLEMLLVIAIIAILAGIVIVAINPAKQLADANNAQRYSDLRAIHQGMEQYFLDNGEYPNDIPTDLTEVCDTGSISGDADAAGGDYSGLDCDDDGLIDLSLLVPTYIPEVPTDPSGPLAWFVNEVLAADGAGYMVGKPTVGKLAAVAPNTQNLDDGDDLVIQIGTSTVSCSEVRDDCGDGGGYN